MSGPNATVTRTNVLSGPGQIWYDTFAAAVEPADADVGSPLTGTWVDAGATDGGLTITVNQSFFSMMVDQVPDSLGERLTDRSVTVATNFAEGTLEAMAVALNNDPAVAVTEDPTVPPVFKSFEAEAGQDAMRPTELAIVVDGWAPGDAQLRRRVILRRVNSIENVGSAFTKDGLFLIPVTFKALYVDSTTPPWKVVDELPA